MLAALATLVGRADAKRLPECTCPAQIVLPQPGASGLPSNAKLWTIDQTHTLSYEAIGTHRYVSTMQSESRVPTRDDDLTLDGDADHEPPRAPRGVNVSITAAYYGNETQIETLSAWGDFDPDTAIVEIRLWDDASEATLYTTPHRLYLCQLLIPIGATPLHVSVRAIDIAGNTSPPYETTTDPQFDPERPDPSTQCDGGYHRHHHGHGFEILGLIFLWLIFLVCWLVYLLGRRIGAKRGVAEDVPVLAAEEIIRRLLRWQIVWTAMLAFAIFGLYAADDDMALVSVMLAPVGVVAFCRLIVVHYASRLLQRGEASAVRYGRWLCIQTLRDSQLVRASDADFVAGKRASLPRSVAR